MRAASASNFANADVHALNQLARELHRRMKSRDSSTLRNYKARSSRRKRRMKTSSSAPALRKPNSLHPQNTPSKSNEDMDESIDLQQSMSMSNMSNFASSLPLPEGKGGHVLGHQLSHVLRVNLPPGLSCFPMLNTPLAPVRMQGQRKRNLKGNSTSQRRFIHLRNQHLILQHLITLGPDDLHEHLKEMSKVNTDRDDDIFFSPDVSVDQLRKQLWQVELEMNEIARARQRRALVRQKKKSNLNRIQIR